MEGGEEGRVGAFLVYGAAAHDNLSQARLINESGFEGGRRPLGGIGLLHVVHEVEAEGARSAGIQRGKDAGLAIGGDFRRLLESRLAKHARGEVTVVVHAAVFGSE